MDEKLKKHTVLWFSIRNKTAVKYFNSIDFIIYDIAEKDLNHKLACAATLFT